MGPNRSSKAVAKAGGNAREEKMPIEPRPWIGSGRLMGEVLTGRVSAIQCGQSGSTVARAQGEDEKGGEHDRHRYGAQPSELIEVKYEHACDSCKWSFGMKADFDSPDPASLPICPTLPHIRGH